MWLRLTLLLMLLSGCGTVVSDSALCDATAQARDQAAAAVLIDGGEQSIIAVANLLQLLDKGC